MNVGWFLTRQSAGQGRLLGSRLTRVYLPRMIRPREWSFPMLSSMLLIFFFLVAAYEFYFCICVGFYLTYQLWVSLYRVLRLQAGHKYCLLGQLSSEVGWNHYDTIKVSFFKILHSLCLPQVLYFLDCSADAATLYYIIVRVGLFKAFWWWIMDLQFHDSFFFSEFHILFLFGSVIL